MTTSVEHTNNAVLGPTWTGRWGPAWLNERPAPAVAPPEGFIDTTVDTPGVISEAETKPDAPRDRERFWDFAPLPAEFFEAHEFYLGQMRPKDLGYLLARSVTRRCPWCWRLNGNHALACRQLHSEWTIKIPFGKYKGQAISELPIDYLRWLRNTAHLEEDLRDEIDRVLGCREGPQGVMDLEPE